MPTDVFNQAACERAKAELDVFQSNISVQTANGSEIRGIWEGHRFVDYALGEPIVDVTDFWIEPRFKNCPGVCCG